MENKPQDMKDKNHEILVDFLNNIKDVKENKNIKLIGYMDFYETIIKINLNNKDDKIFEPIKQNFENKEFKYKIVGFYGSKIKGKTILFERLLKQYENFEFFQKINSFEFLFDKNLTFFSLQKHLYEKSLEQFSNDEKKCEYIKKMIQKFENKINSLQEKLNKIKIRLKNIEKAPINYSHTPLSLNSKSISNLILLDTSNKKQFLHEINEFNYKTINNSEILNNLKRIGKIINQFILTYSNFIIYVTNDFNDKKIKKFRQFSENNPNKKIIIIHNLFQFSDEIKIDYFKKFNLKEDFFIKKITPTNFYFKEVNYNENINVFIEKKYINIIHITMFKDKFEKKNKNIYNYSNINFLTKMIYYDNNNTYDSFDILQELKKFKKSNEKLFENQINLIEFKYFVPNFISIKQNKFILLVLEISNFPENNLKNIKYQIKFKENFYLFIIKGQKDKYEINDKENLKSLKEDIFIKTFKFNYSDGLIKKIGDFYMEENSGLIKVKLFF